MSSPMGASSLGSSQTESQPQLRPSGRKGSRKVRTGCITCKVRKVKCDETKPSCLRCTKTGRRCDGYLLPRQSNKAADLFASRDAAGLRSAIRLIPDWLAAADELRAFDYYRTQSAVVLGGDLTVSFWANLVPRFCHAEPAVRHAVLALSGLHELLDKSAHSHHHHSSWLPQDDFAIRHYGKAIAHLKSWKAEDGDASAVPLICCILFICIEFILNNEPASQVHICQGREILAALDGKVNTSYLEVIKRDVVPIFTRLSISSFLFGNTPARIPSFLQGSDLTAKQFDSMDEVRRQLDGLIDEALRFYTGTRAAAYAQSMDSEEYQALVTEQHRQLVRLRHWNVAASICLATKGDGSLAVRIATCQTQVFYHGAIILVSTALTPLETSYDNLLPSFAGIVIAASTILQAYASESNQARPGSAPRGRFTFETELIPNLYLVVIKCRHPHLRRAALQLLNSPELKSRRENLWDSGIMAAVGARYVEIEEMGFHAQDPAAAEQESAYPSISSTNLHITHQSLPDIDDENIAAVSKLLASTLKVPLGRAPQVRANTIHEISEISSMPTVLIPPIGSKPTSREATNVPQSRPSPSSDDSSLSSPSQSPNRQPSPAMPAGGELDRLSEPGDLSTVTVEPPFGIPESRRIKNAPIGPHRSNGTWVTFFCEPQDEGATEWVAVREFVVAK